MPLRIGDILVELGVLTDHMREEILDEQRIVGKPFGELAERMFNVDPTVIEDAWARQYEQIAGVFSFNEVRIDSAATSCVTARQAWQFKLMPVRFEHGELMIATTREELEARVDALQVAVDRLDAAVVVLATALAERRQGRLAGIG